MSQTIADSKATPPATATPEEPLPERPQLAPGVELSGEMQESGFAKQQWLVQRDGRFIQLTELLYRVAEQADGERTHEEMARGVSEATGRSVSAGNVRTLLEKLIPLGLIVKADGSVAEVGSGPRSPLAVNMRMAMIGPQYIDPIARVLQPLYQPVILIIVLVAAAVSQVWLFAFHGIASPAREAIAKPGLLLPLLGVIIVSTAWHEFGHATALRYGGGKVRGMGAGLYLIYPAFYTDVTDAYRLGRWGKVRTDLGGFYFNLIFALGLIGIYFLTGAEWLLVVILLIDLEIIHQCLPLVRLDGYWALADLTGIPDFFSQIGPFLRTVLPLHFWKGPRLPDLKGWVKAVFALYLLSTIPLLTFLLFAMIKGVPRVLATGWSSFNTLRGDFTQAQGAGNVLGMVTTGLQIVLLALPTLGTVYILVKLAKSAATALWHWSKPTPARRATGSVVAVAAVAGLALLWAPQIPFFTKPGGEPTRGPLYAQAQENFVPIAPYERGTVPDLLGSQAVVDPPSAPPIVITPTVGIPGAPTAAPAAAPTSEPSPTTGPAQTPGPTPGASVSPTPAATGTAAPGPTATSAPTSVPTPTPGSAAPTVPASQPTAVPAAPTNPPASAPTSAPVPTATPTSPAALPTAPQSTVPPAVSTLVPTIVPTNRVIQVLPSPTPTP